MKASEGIRVLVADARQSERETIGRALEEAGFLVSAASSIDEGRKIVEREGLPHLLLIAPRLSLMDDEINFCREVHQTADVPTIAMAQQPLHGEAAFLIEECADDFIPLPARPEEIVMRVRRLLRRLADYSYRNATVLTEIAPGVRYDRRSQVLDVAGQTIVLTDREAQLLHLLVRHENRVLSSDYLLQHLWPYEDVGGGTLRVTVHRLRQKVEPRPDEPRHILSVRGRGYTFCASGHSPS